MGVVMNEEPNNFTLRLIINPNATGKEIGEALYRLGDILANTEMTYNVIVLRDERGALVGAATLSVPNKKPMGIDPTDNHMP